MKISEQISAKKLGGNGYAMTEKHGMTSRFLTLTHSEARRLANWILKDLDKRKGAKTK